jgi:hypothetical protein
MSWEIIVPVVIGGLLTIAGGFAAEWWRGQREDQREAERAARTSLQALRGGWAREFGVTDLDDNGEWVVGDLSRLSDH